MNSTKQWAWRVVYADFRSSRGFVWPFPGGVAEAPGPINEKNTDACPSAPGDGVCLAKTWAGAASGGISSATVLLCSYESADVLGETGEKMRVRRATVEAVWDGWRLIREGGASADLRGADLRGANLYGANLRGADLYGANLRGADLYGADLREADLRGANLYGADLYGANLYGANLRGADLYGADLCEANLCGANLRGANLRGAQGYTPPPA